MLEKAFSDAHTFCFKKIRMNPGDSISWKKKKSRSLEHICPKIPKCTDLPVIIKKN